MNRIEVIFNKEKWPSPADVLFLAILIAYTSVIIHFVVLKHTTAILDMKQPGKILTFQCPWHKTGNLIMNRIKPLNFEASCMSVVALTMHQGMQVSCYSFSLSLCRIGIPPYYLKRLWSLSRLTAARLLQLGY